MADVAPAPSFKKRTNKSTNVRKRPATPPPEDAASTSESDYTDDEGGARVKRRKKDGVAIQASSAIRPQDLSKFTKYSADRSTAFTANDSATKTSNWSVSDAAAAAAAQKATNAPEATAHDMPTENNGNYKGTSTYSSFIQKNPNARDSPGQKQVGPVKAASNVRTITVTDFAPDVCKDYKQTGFCGFGDSCKFLHAREDYKQGWQLDKEWEKAGKKDKPTTKDDGDMDEEEKLLSTIPFKCIICKEDYKNPIVTRCGHYFCQKCAMGRYMKEKKKSCANCGADTNGTFNVGKKLKDLLARKQKREEERAEKAEAEEA